EKSLNSTASGATDVSEPSPVPQPQLPPKAHPHEHPEPQLMPRKLAWSGMSSSASVAKMIWLVTPGALTVNVACPLTWSRSVAAAMVTFWGTFQLAGVKTRVAPELTLKSVSPLVNAVFTVASAANGPFQCTVKLALP